ncbi:hypothetical protein POM88_034402 [Heracleum sosnowskyi]|uniref:Uncharacterized protein n=1 Tax=Heracleum sosnowskyi TaxID=360622 RepID=A0AAD8MAI2_9APIA|nr:hypothetical protein POM88_034402 [Heracleum sosnowskyi]
MSSERPPGFDGTLRPGESTVMSPTNRILNFDSEGDEGPLPTPEEQKELLLKWREEHATKQGKLMQNWEGSYTVVEVVRPGTYKLSGPDGSLIKKTLGMFHASVGFTSKLIGNPHFTSTFISAISFSIFVSV